MKLKVLHVINSLDTGGAEILLTNSLSPGGLCEHTENHLAFFMAPELVGRLDSKVRVHDLKYKGGVDMIRLLRQLRNIIIEQQIDIVHTHLNPSGTYIHFVCPKHIPHVHTIHTTYSMDKETTPFKLWTEREFYLKRKDTNLIFLSDFTKADFLKHVRFRGRAFVLNNFVDDKYFNLPKEMINRSTGELRLIAVGALRLPKNYEYLIEVFMHLKGQPISLDIYGGGDTAPYQKLIDEYGLENVKMKGQTSSIDRILTSYDMFIMSSTFEGFPLSVFEAMAAGVPLMLSDIAPLKSIISNHAIYFKLNDPEGTAAQLINVLKNREAVNSMAETAKLYAATTAKREIYIKKLLGIYNQLTGTLN